MDLDQIRSILNLVREHELSEFEIEHDGLRLKIRKDANGAHLVTHAAPAMPAVVVAAAACRPCPQAPRRPRLPAWRTPKSSSPW
jgi:hypothetical protein